MRISTLSTMLAGLALLASTPALGGHAAAAGQELFVAQKCTICHSVDSAGIEQTSKMKGSDLSGVADRRDRAWLKGYLLKEIELDGKAHKKAIKLEDAELEQLLDFLMTLGAG